MELNETQTHSEATVNLKILLLIFSILLIVTLGYFVFFQSKSTSTGSSDSSAVTTNNGPLITTPSANNISSAKVIVTYTPDSLTLYNLDGSIGRTVGLKNYAGGNIENNGKLGWLQGNDDYFYTFDAMGTFTKSFLKASDTSWIHPFFSPDGKKVLWTEANGTPTDSPTTTAAYISDVDGSHKIKLLSEAVPDGNFYTPIQLSVDNSTAYLSFTVDGLGGGPGTHYGVNGAVQDLFAIDVATLKKTTITTGQAYTVTPDSQYTLETTEVDKDGTLKFVTSEKTFSITHPGYQIIYGAIFSPDKKHIAYVAFTRDKHEDGDWKSGVVASNGESDTFTDNFADFIPAGWLDDSTVIGSSYSLATQLQSLISISLDGLTKKTLAANLTDQFVIGVLSK